jgi:hypothetical protein
VLQKLSIWTHHSKKLGPDHPGVTLQDWVKKYHDLSKEGQALVETSDLGVTEFRKVSLVLLNHIREAFLHSELPYLTFSTVESIIDRDRKTLSDAHGIAKSTGLSKLVERILST